MGETVWKGGVTDALAKQNADRGTRYSATELAYPANPYPWQNIAYCYCYLRVGKTSSPDVSSQPT